MRERWPHIEYTSPEDLFDSLYLKRPNLFLLGLLVLAATGLSFITFGVSPVSAIPLPIAGAFMLASTKVIRGETLVSPKEAIPIYRPSVTDFAILTLVVSIMLAVFVWVTPAAAYDVDVSMVKIAIVGLVMFGAVGPVEEVVFRHIVQRKVLWGHWSVRVFIASVVFGLAHSRVLLGSPDFVAFSVIILLGGILGAAYEATGNLTVPIVAHGAYNTFVFAAPLLL